MRSRIVFSILVVLSACVACPFAWAYTNNGADGGPHRRINELALKQFIVDSRKDPFFSHYDFYPSEVRYGLRLATGEYPFMVEYLTILPPGIMYEERISRPTRFPFMSAYIEEEPVIKDFSWWVSEGGYTANEPHISVALRHYYDPACKAIDLPDKSGVDYLTDALTPPVFASIINCRMSAYVWAIDKSPYSYAKGQIALKLALSATPGGDEKQAYYGKAWRSLGETMHVLADMTVPAHVRNDVHLDSPTPGDRRSDPYEVWVTAKKVSECAKSPLNPQIGRAIGSAVDIEGLFKQIARFTNSHCFSSDTISGTDAVTRKHVTNANKQPEYDAPKLAGDSYQPDKGGISGYYAAEDGKLIAYRTKDGTHTVDFIVAATQAKELIPAAIAANAKLISLYMPRVKLLIDSFDVKSSTAKCRAVTYTKNPASGFIPNQSAGNPSSGNKAVVFATFTGGKRSYFLPMQKMNGGQFVLDLSSVIADARKSPDKAGTCTASCAIGLDMGGIVVKSEPVLVLGGKKQLQSKSVSSRKAPISGRS